MKRVKKYSKWLIICAGIFVVLIAALYVVASKIVKTESTKQKVQALISKKLGGEIEYESMRIYLFHRPHITVTRGEFSIPDKVDAKFNTLTVYPKILPLLRGKVDVAAIKLMSPDIKLHIPEESLKQQGKEVDRSIDSIISDLKGVLNHLNEKERDLNVRIYNGSFTLDDGTESELSIKNTNASVSLPGGVLKLNITSKSDIWDKVALRGSLDTETYSGTLSLGLSSFKPHKLIEIYSEDIKLIKDSDIDIELDIKTSEFKTLDVKVKSDVKKLILFKNNEELELSARDINADISVDDDGTRVTLDKAKFLFPTLNVSGKFEIDRDSDHHKLELRSTGVNIEEARESTLFVAGDINAVRILFEIVRGGSIPDIKVTAAGNSLKDMWRKGNYEVRGNMVDGRIFIPDAEFDIVDAKGDALISDGRLKASNLSAKMGNSRGYDGELIIGIEGREGPLYLDIMLDGDVADVPPILERFVDDELFIRELTKIKNLQGSAKGKLLLGDFKHKLKPKVYISEFKITSEYERVPYPLEIKGGNFNYEDKRIEVENLGVQVGMLSSTGISGSFIWHDEHVIDIEAGDTEIDIGKFYPWLISQGTIKEHLHFVESLTGTAALSGFKFSGPLMTLPAWQIESSGTLRDVKGTLSEMDDEIILPETKYDVTTSEISFPSSEVLSSENTLNIGLSISNYLSGPFGMEADFSGSIGPELGNMIAHMVKVPEQLRLKSSATFDDSSFSWRNGFDTDGEIVTSTGVSNVPGKNVELDIGIVAESIEWLSSEEKSETQKVVQKETSGKKGPGTSINGEVKVSSGKFAYKNFDWSSVDTNVGFKGDKININVDAATLCGIATPGLVSIISPNLSFEFNPATSNEDIEQAVKCLLNKAGIISGDFDFEGNIGSKSQILTDASYPDLINSIEGDFQITSKGGHITKFGGLAKFFSALNFGDIFRGQAPDYGEGGFPYDYLVVKAKVEDSRLVIEEAALDGASLKVVCKGHIDILEKTIDMDILVVPIMAIDSFIEKIPLISSVLGEKYVSLPVKIKGSLSDPEIKEISPHTLRAGILGLIKETLNIPATIIKPVSKGHKHQEESDTKE